jgi:hypothetical protein
MRHHGLRYHITSVVMRNGLRNTGFFYSSVPKKILLKYKNIFSCLENANRDNHHNKDDVQLHKS